MKIREILKNELEGWGKLEFWFFIVSLITVSVCSLVKGDEILSVIAAVCGIIYTFSAGKGKIYCYLFGILSTTACGYIALRVSLFGTGALYFLYYLPMEIWGFFSWKKHLKKDSNEIVKTKLSKKELMVFSSSLVIISLVCIYIFIKMQDSNPAADALVLVLSIGAMLMTVKRCIEQWALWTIVNLLSVWLWFEVFFSGERTFSLFIIRIIYFILGIYFFYKWKKQLS